MNRALFIISVIVINGCSNQSDQFSSGLTKNAKKITEYLINTDTDSLNGLPIDTLTKTEKFYNKNGHIIKTKLYYLYSDESMIIDFKYDIRKRLKNEIIELVDDSIKFSVDYSYRGTLLNTTKSEFDEKEFRSKQIGNYYYDSNDKLESSTVLQQFIDIETNDTVTYTFELNNYNDKEQIVETILMDSINLDKNRIFKYDYKDEILFKTTEYNQDDSLISITLYEYKLDKYGNWIERKTIRDNKLTTLMKREIEYK